MTNNMTFIFTLSLSILGTAFILPHLIHISVKTGLMAVPNHRTVHILPKPLCGGIGIMFGALLSCLAFIPTESFRGLYVGIIVLLIFGVLDDFREISHRSKFVAQIIAAIAMIFLSDTVIFHLGDLLSLGTLYLAAFSIPFTMLATIGVTNALNLIDGLDGLAGGLSLIASITFGIFSYLNDQTELMLLSAALSGAVLVFLWYNWYPSKLFMGDAGSLCIGFTLVYLSVAITQQEESLIPPVAALIVLAVPITDTIVIMTRRVLQGKSPFHADRYHLHHIMLRFGFSKKNAVKAILLLSIMLSIAAVLGVTFKIHEHYFFLAFLVYFISVFISSFYIKEMLRFKVRTKSRIVSNKISRRSGRVKPARRL